jgi:hypothetical protein
MMKKLFFVFLIFTGFCVRAQNWNWARESPTGGLLNKKGKVAVDPVTGCVFNLIVTYGSFYLPGYGTVAAVTGDYNSYIVKYDANGTFISVKSYAAGGSFDNIEFDQISISPSGRIFVSGSTQSCISDPVLGALSDGYFVGEIDLAGNFIHAESSSGEPFIVATGTGVCFAIKYHNTSSGITFYGHSFPAEFAYSVIYGKFDYSYNMIWAGVDGGSNPSDIDMVTGIDASENRMVICGVNHNTMVFGSFSLSVGGDEKYFAIIDAANGNVLYAEGDNEYSGFVRDCAVSDVNGDVQLLIEGLFAETWFGQSLVAGGRYVMTIDSSINLKNLIQLGLTATTTYFNAPRAICVDNNNDFFVFGEFTDTLVIDGHLLLSSGTGYFIAKFDEIGNPIWSNTLPATVLESWQWNGKLYSQGYFGDPTTVFGTDTLHGANHFISVFEDDLNEVSGRIYKDVNNDSAFNSGDHVLPLMTFNLPMYTPFGYSTTSGLYNAILDSGTFCYKPLPHVLHYHLNPDSLCVYFSSCDSSAFNYDFNYLPDSGVTDIEVSLIPVTPIKPGFPASHKIRMFNAGTVSINFQVKLLPDTLFTITTMPIGAIFSGDTLIMNYSVIGSDSTIFESVSYSVSYSAPLGYAAMSKAWITSTSPEFFMDNNYYELKQIVVGSYDPNDKTSNPPEAIEFSEVPSTTIDYVIRFQNTGTDTAVNVLIIDTLSSFLDLSTFEAISSSSPVMVTAFSGNRINFQFNNIYLPDSSTDELNSHGYINYRIKPVSSLVNGDKILNTAYIYFDFNIPIVTNVSTIEIVEGLIVNNPSVTLNNFSVYPNPFASTINILNSNNRRIQEIRCYDGTGRCLMQNEINGSQQQVSIFVNGFAPGLYFVDVVSENNHHIFKIVK